MPGLRHAIRRPAALLSVGLWLSDWLYLRARSRYRHRDLVAKFLAGHWHSLRNRPGLYDYYERDGLGVYSSEILGAGEASGWPAKLSAMWV